MTAPYDLERVLAVQSITIGVSLAGVILALGGPLIAVIVSAGFPVLFIGLLALDGDDELERSHAVTDGGEDDPALHDFSGGLEDQRDQVADVVAEYGSESVRDDALETVLRGDAK